MLADDMSDDDEEESDEELDLEAMIKKNQAQEAK